MGTICANKEEEVRRINTPLACSSNIFNFMQTKQEQHDTSVKIVPPLVVTLSLPVVQTSLYVTYIGLYIITT